MTNQQRQCIRLTTLIVVCVLLLPVAAFAQDGGAAPVSGSEATSPEMPSLWNLAIQGGWFMIPIGIASVITIAFTLERLGGLRRERILPKALIAELRELIKSPTVDPRKLWELCEGNASPLANVGRSAVLKTGRPQPEVESAVMDAVERETGEMTRNLRPINVVASISPLLGLLGTVQGMIMAFMVTSTTSSTGTAKAQELAHGIYTALVTTFAGLTVAVVSVVLANFIEGRIERLLKQMEGIFLDLLPRLEAYEGKLRVAEALETEEGGIKVKNAMPAVAPSVAQAASDASKKQTSRKLGSPKRIVRRSASPEKKPPVPVSADTVSDTETVPQKSGGSLETLRANFDR